jgi:hypothetical protein
MKHRKLGYIVGFGVLGALLIVCGLEMTSKLGISQIFFGESLGETGLVLVGFYECKDGPTPGTWAEVTSLMLTNASNRYISGTIVFLDGNQNIIAHSPIELSPEDLDEINVSRTLEAGGVPVPSAGMIEIILYDPDGGEVGGVYGWMKNVVGKFFKVVDEPFDGRVTGVGKTECRVVPPSVTTRAEIEGKILASGSPEIDAILIEGTDDIP